MAGAKHANVNHPQRNSNQRDDAQQRREAEPPIGFWFVGHANRIEESPWADSDAPRLSPPDGRRARKHADAPYHWRVRTPFRFSMTAARIEPWSSPPDLPALK